MYKITIDHLEKIKKALENSNKTLASANTEDKKRKAIAQNNKVIQIIEGQFLNVKP